MDHIATNSFFNKCFSKQAEQCCKVCEDFLNSFAVIHISGLVISHAAL